MSLIIKKIETVEYDPCPQGVYDAVCCQVLDLGLQDGNYGLKRQVRIAFELNKLRDDGKPWFIGSTYTLSLHKKAALHQLLLGWRGKAFGDGEEFDIENLLGKFCQVHVTHNFVPQADGSVKTYANIGGVTASKTEFKPVNDFVTADEALDLSEFWQAKIEAGHAALAKQQEQDLANQATSDKQVGNSTADLNDEVPF